MCQAAFFHLLAAHAGTPHRGLTPPVMTRDDDDTSLTSQTSQCFIIAISRTNLVKAKLVIRECRVIVFLFLQLF